MGVLGDDEFPTMFDEELLGESLGSAWPKDEALIAFMKPLHGYVALEGLG